jgi:GDPmannose 4,6-dehydratase
MIEIAGLKLPDEMNGKIAIVSGCTGQDGSWLAELLLEKGYRVIGLMRRASTPNDYRLKVLNKVEEQMPDRFMCEYWDLIDDASIRNVIKKYQPTHFFNTAAMSHVAISFPTPIATAEYNAVGVLRILEAIREIKPDCHFLQCSSSEMFGLTPPPQDELTRFMPSSPYGAAKVYAYHITRIYREAYGMFTCNTICFNHEGSIPKNSALLLKDSKGLIDIKPIEDLFRTDKHKYEGILDEYYDYNIWDGENWTEILDGHCYKNNDKPMKLISTRDGSYEATHNHILFLEDGKELPTEDLSVGMKLFKTNYPVEKEVLLMEKDMAYLLGFIAGDGYISKSGKIRLIGTNKEEISKVAEILVKRFGWGYRISKQLSGFKETHPNSKDVFSIDFNNNTNYGLWLRSLLYTDRSNEKRVPKIILNADKETIKSFFDGYYLADGRKKGNEAYEYKGFTTASQTLCLGLNYIFKKISKQTIKVKTEYRKGKIYYYTQFGTPNKKGKCGNNLMKDLNEIINIIATRNNDGWFYDIGTDSKAFATGPNLIKIHNSRRGVNFVTRKVTRNLAKIVKGDINKFQLGNLDALRDWGSSKDYVKAMEMIINHDKADDFVVATRETHSIKEFLEEAFNLLGLKWEDYIEISDKFKRPLEVPALLGEPKKFEDTFKWSPPTKFKELVYEMLDNDLKEIGINGIEEAKEIISKW